MTSSDANTTDFVGYEKEDCEGKPTSEGIVLCEDNREDLKEESDLIAQLQPLYAGATPPASAEISALRNTLGLEINRQARACMP